jgi:phosphate transport system substrate-binding protein
MGLTPKSTVPDRTSNVHGAFTHRSASSLDQSIACRLGRLSKRRRYMTRRLFALVGAAALTLVGTACGGGGGGGGGGGVQGAVNVSGSSTVLPISQLLAQDFSQQNPDAQIKVNGPGTTDGFVLFCKGETDINDASRAIESDEVKACSQNGVDYIELPIAYDGITVMTNPANKSVSCLSKADLYSLIGPESKGFKNWSDANALDKELGGDGNFPNEPFDLVGPGPESGTWGSFIDLALKDIADSRNQPDDRTRPDYQSSGNDNVIIQGIEASNSSLGWVGFAYAEENATQVKILGVSPDENKAGEGNPDCVTPSRDTIASQDYPLSRTLYIYVNKKKAQQNKALRAFVDLYLSDEGITQGVQQAGYVDLPSDQISKTRSTWSSFENS